MRLINTSSLAFKEFYGSDCPPYAILSHTWGSQEEEVTFQEYDYSINNDDKLSSLRSRSGMSKILGCAAKAAEQNLGWVWIDTCCIDKKSSSELSEAINSMYRWYQDAVVCYVYLNDPFYSPEKRGILSRSPEAFTSHRWFTRGWTLQELLAPKTVLFFDHGWNCLGDRLSLKAQISAATKIELRHLEKPEPACVATKMSWASKRVTSRAEDLAYSLLGLFDVNMPMLYGEGGVKAFIRLQMEIIRKSDDESIFAWTDPNATESGLLSTTPHNFKDAANMWIARKSLSSRLPYSMTHKGLLFNVPTHSGARNDISPINQLLEDKTLYLALYCGKHQSEKPKDSLYRLQYATIVLQRSRAKNTWQRIQCHELLFREEVKPSFNHQGNSTTKIIYVAQEGM